MWQWRRGNRREEGRARGGEGEGEGQCLAHGHEHRLESLLQEHKT